uniref:Cytochrome c oxidase subunit 7A2 like n=1 Tax=Bos taurus TaxID=9913 RepID=A0AAF6YHP6_BOVIN
RRVLRLRLRPTPGKAGSFSGAVARAVAAGSPHGASCIISSVASRRSWPEHGLPTPIALRVSEVHFRDQDIGTPAHSEEKTNSEGLRPVVSTEAPPIIFATPTKLSSGPTAYDYAGKNTVPELQKFFQKSDGVPIHLKRGLPDQMLYRTTMALTVGGTIYCLIALYMASQPRNK